jgi:hypothetical protein
MYLLSDTITSKMQNYVTDCKPHTFLSDVVARSKHELYKLEIINYTLWIRIFSPAKLVP